MRKEYAAASYRQTRAGLLSRLNEEAAARTIAAMTVTGATPLGAYDLRPDPRRLRPVPILAEWVDPDTGDITMLNQTRTPVDGAIIEGLRVDRGSGSAVMDVGQTLRKVRHTDDSSLGEIPERARDGVRELERLGLIRFEKPLRVTLLPGGDGVDFEGECIDFTTKPATRREVNAARTNGELDR